MKCMQAMKVDVSVKRVAAFAKRMLQVAVQSPAPFAAGILFLLSEVLKVCYLCVDKHLTHAWVMAVPQLGMTGFSYLCSVQLLVS